MKSYMQMSREELLSLKASLEEEFKTEESERVVFKYGTW